MPHELPALPYDYRALEPHIGEETLRVHHQVIHKAHVDAANQAEEALAAARADREYALVSHWTRQIAYHGSGHYLHCLYWKSMSPGGGGEPTDALMNALRRDFGDLNAFRAHFTAAAGAIEGSGWAVLGVVMSSGRLGVFQCENHQNLVPWGVVPVLVCDVWEHAYFIKYRHRRAEYLRAFFNVVDWQGVASTLASVGR